MPKYASVDGVRVDGLDDFRRALKQLDAGWARELAKTNKAAGEMIARRARQRAIALGSTAAHVADTIKTAAQQRHVAITLGNDRHPEALGAEFGAKRWPQFEPWRGNQWEPDATSGVGYFLHPEIRESADEFMDQYDDMLGDLTRRAFPQGA